MRRSTLKGHIASNKMMDGWMDGWMDILFIDAHPKRAYNV